MPTTAPNPDHSCAERLILEQAQAFAQELLRIANDAPDGQVLRLAELFVLDRGRELLRFALANALQAQAGAVEKKGRRAAPVRAGVGATTKGGRPSSA
jgi:hypothetical protein